MERVKLTDVARAAGVHPGTASRALNPTTRDQVSRETSRHVLLAAQRLGYVPNTLAIDWIKASQRCLTREDFCPNGGELDLASLRCIPNTPGRPVTYPTPCVKQ